MRWNSSAFIKVLLAGILVAVAAVMITVAPTSVEAAPFCLSVQGIPDQCVYADGQQCQARAVQLKGVCSANRAEVAGNPGPGQFCLVVGNVAAVCAYQDRGACEADAIRQHTACVAGTGPLPNTSRDPFAITRPY